MRRACTDRDRIFHDNGGTELKFEHNSLLRVKIVFLRDFKRFNRFNSALTRLHPQGKGGPEATFCVRSAWNHHKLMGDVSWRWAKSKILLLLLATNQQILARNLLISGIERDTGETYGRRHARTHEHRYFWPEREPVGFPHENWVWRTTHNRI